MDCDMRGGLLTWSVLFVRFVPLCDLDIPDRRRTTTPHMPTTSLHRYRRGRVILAVWETRASGGEGSLNLAHAHTYLLGLAISSNQAVFRVDSHRDVHKEEAGACPN